MLGLVSLSMTQSQLPYPIMPALNRARFVHFPHYTQPSSFSCHHQSPHRYHLDGVSQSRPSLLQRSCNALGSSPHQRPSLRAHKVPPESFFPPKSNAQHPTELNTPSITPSLPLHVLEKHHTRRLDIPLAPHRAHHYSAAHAPVLGGVVHVRDRGAATPQNAKKSSRNPKFQTPICTHSAFQNQKQTETKKLTTKTPNPQSPIPGQQSHHQSQLRALLLLHPLRSYTHVTAPPKTKGCCNP